MSIFPDATIPKLLPVRLTKISNRY